MEHEKNTSMYEGLKYIIENLREYKVACIFVIISILFAAFFQVLAPRLLADAIDQLARYTANPKPNLYLTFIIVLAKLGLAYLMSALGMFLYIFLMTGVAAKSTGKIRGALFNKLQDLSIVFFDKSNDGDILSRFTNDIDNIATLLSQSFIQVAAAVCLIISVAISMLISNVFLALIILFLAFVTTILVMFFTSKASKYVSLQQHSLGELNGYIDEKVAGQKLIITTGTEKSTYKGFLSYNERYRDASKKGQAFSNLLFPMVNGIMLLTIAIVVFFSADLIYANVMSVGMLTMFIAYIQNFFRPITDIVSQYNILRLGVTGAGRVIDILDVEEEVKDTGRVVFKKLKKDVRLEDVSFAYEDKYVLRDINIAVKKGQKVALVGQTGSGKTTIMNLLNRFYDIQIGEILVDDINIKDYTLSSLRQKVGIVLQESVLFSGTVAYNICYGKKNATQKEMVKAAKMANIHDYIMQLENGYETIIDNNSSIFSVGQKQLISIARTLLTNPELLIFDEATSNVDTITEERIQEAMNNILLNRTSFVIAHRLKTVLDADLIIVLEHGCVIEQGTHEQLLKLNGTYAELYYNQFLIQ